jgi:hypothetical protein
MGYKVFSKFTKTSSEEFNCKVFVMLDTMKQMEKQYKLSDPKSIVVDTLYHTHGHIDLIAWVQKEHTDLITDHDWSALTAQLPDITNASMYNATSTVVEHCGTFVENGTCHPCKEKSHIRPHCPKLTNRRNGGGTCARSDPEETKKNALTPKPLASWKYIEPKYLTISHTDEDGGASKCCTKFKCKVTNKTGIFQLSHLDSEHVDNFRSLSAQANLTSVNDPNGGIPAGPPLSTVLEPAPADENEMVFTGAWCCQFTLPPALRNRVVTTTRGRTLAIADTLDDVLDPAPDSSDDESSVGPPPLGPRDGE